MTRRTSIDVFNQIESEGLLSKLRFQAYSILFNHGPMTACEIVAKGREIYPSTRPRDSWNQRLSELRDRGVIYEVRERICRITGRNVIEWDVTEQLPVDPPRPAPKQTQQCPHCSGSGEIPIAATSDA